MAALETMVSKKHEIEESYWRVDANRNLTSEQRRQQTGKLDKEGKQMEYKAYTFAFIAIMTTITVTGLLAQRCKILERKKAAHNTGLLQAWCHHNSICFY